MILSELWCVWFIWSNCFRQFDRLAVWTHQGSEKKRVPNLLWELF